MVTYAKISPKMVNLRDIAGNVEKEKKTILCKLCLKWQLLSIVVTFLGDLDVSFSCL